jgi:hypothetical protein
VQDHFEQSRLHHLIVERYRELLYGTRHVQGAHRLATHDT